MRAVLGLAIALLAVPASAQKAAAPAERPPHRPRSRPSRRPPRVRAALGAEDPEPGDRVRRHFARGHRPASGRPHPHRPPDPAHGSRPSRSRGPSHADGLHYTLVLRRGLRFSDGQPFDADDVVFTFRCYLDERNASPQRDLLDHRRQADRSAQARRLPGRLRSGAAVRGGRAALRQPGHPASPPPREGPGRGPARRGLGTGYSARRDGRARSVPPEVVRARRAHRARAQPVLLEGRFRRPSPFPISTSSSSCSCPATTPQVVRFKAGETDVISRLSAAELRRPLRRGLRRAGVLEDLGAGLDYTFLFFNLNDLDAAQAAGGGAQAGLVQADRHFRQAVSAAIDRAGHGTPRLSGTGDPSRRPT